MESTAPDWVSETRFGKWFLSTRTWYRYVLTVAIEDLRAIGGQRMHLIGRLLDVGCGQGRSFGLLAKHFKPREIVAVDIDPVMVETARLAAKDCPVPVTVKQSSVSRLELPDASVDVVFCHQLIHHVADQRRVLGELHRVLAPGGYLLLGESCESFIHIWSVRWFFRHPPGVQHPAEGYVQLVRDAGFVVEERDVRTSTPWWSLPDLGIARKYGLQKNVPPPTELLLVARKPDRIEKSM
ncbi:MAG: class I SAM-dependent methyltransferase [Steroidobacteraceae bacterium]|nr:class I SAM-dependent methyltransferase [Steroidobacteraceae bacterium]